MSAPDNCFTRAEAAEFLGIRQQQLSEPAFTSIFKVAWSKGGHYCPKDDPELLRWREARIQTGAVVPAGAAVPTAVPAVPVPDLAEVHAFMQADLAKSGLVPSDIGAEPMITRKGEAGYLIPYWRPNGGAMGKMYRLRLLPTEAVRLGRKYNQPSKKGIGDDAVHPYFPPGWTANAGSGILDIHEGEKKAACAVKHAKQAAIAIGGCQNWYDPSHKGKVHPAIVEIIAAHGIKTVRCWPDGDIAKPDVQMGWGGLARALKTMGVEVTMMDMSALGQDAKFDDVVAAKGVEHVMANVRPCDFTGMKISHAELLRTFPELVSRMKKSGDDMVEELTPIEHNLMVLMRHHPFFTGRLWYDMDRMQYMFGDAPWVGDTTVMEVLSLLQSSFGFNKRGATAERAKVEACMLAVARENQRSPFRDSLRGLKWDGVPRLDTWLVRYCHATDHPVVREAGKRWLTGLVHRVFNPGCFHRFMLITSGPQSVGKSGLPDALVGTHNVSDFNDDDNIRDAAMILHSGIVIRFDELAGIRRRDDIEHLKALVSATQDTFRAPYERSIEKHLRHAVLYGTVNPEDESGAVLANDPSGNNRFVVVPVCANGEGKFDFAGLAAVRDQLFAEAMMLMNIGYEHAEVPGANAYAKQFERESAYLEPVIDAIQSRVVTGTVIPVSKEDPTPSGFMAVRMSDLCKCLYVSASAVETQRKIGHALRSLGFSNTKTPAALGGKGTIWKIEAAKMDEIVGVPKAPSPVTNKLRFKAVES